VQATLFRSPLKISKVPINEERANLHLSSDPRNRHATTRLRGTAVAASKIAI